MSATYDLSTTRGKTRLHAADTNTSNAVFSDDELDYFLTLAGDNPLLAAALALETAATDAARVAIIVRNDSQSSDPTRVAEQLQERAQRLRIQATATDGGAVLVADRDPIFVPAASTTERGNMEPW